jgi:hypothetical protein
MDHFRAAKPVSELNGMEVISPPSRKSASTIISDEPIREYAGSSRNPSSSAESEEIVKLSPETGGSWG